VLAVYLAATIVGGALVALSLATGHHAGALEAHSGGGGDGHAAPGQALLSLRFWTYLAGFGGLAGLLLRLIAHTGEPLCALAAAGVGVLAGSGAHVVVARLSTRGGGTVHTEELVGHTGRLLLPASPGSASRVRLTVGGALHDLTAHADEALAADDEVLVVSVKEGVAQVTRNPVRGGKP
jgi:membrane protein implicated in regulation of membrane protease activity